MRSMTICSCIECHSSFMRRTAEIKRNPNTFCNKKCYGAWLSKQALSEFMSRTKKVGKCLVWTGSTNSCGYGTVKHFGKQVRAHQLSYILNVAPIPKGLHVLHKCDVPACVNPKHLFLGTHQDNMDDMNKKGRRFRKLPAAPKPGRSEG